MSRRGASLASTSWAWERAARRRRARVARAILGTCCALSALGAAWLAVVPPVGRLLAALAALVCAGLALGLGVARSRVGRVRR